MTDGKSVLNVMFKTFLAHIGLHHTNISRPVALVYLSLRRPLSNFWRKEMAGEKTIYNLGINTTLSRKLLHFQPDVKIAQTIEFSAGQRSTMEQVY